MIFFHSSYIIYPLNEYERMKEKMKKELYDLTNPQKAIWLTEQFSEGEPLNNVSGNIIIKDVVNFPLLEKSLNIYIQKNDALRLQLTMQNNTPKQYLTEYEPFSIPKVELKSKEDWDQFNQTVVSIPFTLFDSPLYAFHLFSFPDGTGGLNVTFHHIVSDAWTMSLFIDEVMSIYEKLLQNQEIDTVPNASYLDYIKAEKEYQESERYHKDETFWKQKFSEEPEMAYIAGHKKQTKHTKAKREIFHLSQDTLEKIQSICKEHKTSVYTFFMCVYSLYLAKVNNISHFVIGTPVLNRSNAKDKKTAGMYISTNAFDFQIDSTKSFSSYLAAISSNQLSIFRHQKYPYTAISNIVKEKYNITENLYDVALSYQNARDNSKNANIPYTTEWLFNGHILESLEIHFYDMDNSGELEIYYDYNIECFQKEDIAKIHQRILYIIDQVLESLNQELKKIEVLPKEEVREIEEHFNNTEEAYDDSISIADLFRLWVQKNPNKEAVIFENQKFTYQQLEEQSNHIAAYLQENGIKNNQIVGILLNKGFPLIVAMLGVLKAGAAYLLIDPSLPAERIQFMLENSDSPLLITQTSIQKIAFPNILQIDTFDFTKTLNLVHVENKPTDTFCVIYTSGSTGVPKGTYLSKKGFLNMLLSYHKKLHIDICERFLCASSVAFDIFLVETLVALFSGKTIVLANEEEQKIPVFMKKLIETQKVDLMLATPSKLELLLAEEETKLALRNIKIIQVGGEVFTSSLYERLRSCTKAHIYNEYGPSECTVCSTTKEITSMQISIGKPFCNTKVYICNKDDNQLPIGFEGEICIVGDGVGKGYVNNIENTKRAFVKNPFGKGNMYKTGDMARLNEKYELEYIGRRDFQVKLRGLRIELSEIDNCIKGIEKVKNAISMIQKVNQIDCICSYIVAKEKISAETIKEELKKVLPYYMVPSHIIFIEEIPLSLNGKIDVKKLPLVSTIEQDFVQATTPTEKKLEEIWKKLLKLEKISVTSNFFELGGDSLCSLRLISDIYTKFSVKLAVKDIFACSTIKKLAEYIDAQTKIETDTEQKIEKTPTKSFYPLSSAQKRIYYTTKIEGENSITYNMPGGILFNKKPDILQLEKAIHTILNRHVAFRTYFVVEEGEVVQKTIDKIEEFHLSVSTMPYSDLDNIFYDFLKPFDLEKAPLIREKLILFDNEKALLLLDMHHIICDGTSMGIFIEELCKLYDGETIENSTQIDYLDYAVWEERYHKTTSFANSKLFWVNQYQKNIPVLDMPTTYARGQARSYKGEKISTILEEELTSKLYKACKKYNTTPYIFLMSIYYILLYKYTGNEDIVVGSPIVGRKQKETENMIGMFVNTLTIRQNIQSKESFESFLKRMTEYLLTCFSHQDYPFDELIENLNIKRVANRSALFDTMFVYQNDGETQMHFKDRETKYYEPDPHIAKFDFSLEIVPKEQNLTCRLEYCTELFSDNFAQKMLSHYVQILNEVLENIQIPVEKIEMLTPYEKTQICEEFNTKKPKFDLKKPFIQVFKEQVEKTPHKVALVFENKKITYKTLDELSDMVAYYLVKKNVKPKDIVAIKMPRSSSIPIAMLGVLKAGAAYLLIDSELPEDRIHDMLQITNCVYMLTSIPDRSITEIPQDFAPVWVENTSPLSVVFTSGSTGTPKGTLLHRRGMLNLIYGYEERMHIKEFEHFASICAVSFDMFAVEIFIPLLTGKTLYLANYEEHKIPTAMGEFITKNKIEFILITPSKLNLLLLTAETRKALNVLKSIQTGGEALTGNFYETIRKYTSALICNEYGPTETTACCSCKEIISPNEITIGKPLPNVQMYICNKEENLCPVGIPGEICIAGEGVSYGYIGREDLTKKVFSPNPFGEGKLYHSGDIAKYNEKGEIVYIGRKDFQIKMHGLRIELSEIEKRILAIPSVTNCKVLYHDEKNNEYLTAFFTSKLFLNVSQIKMELQKYLPLYMVPRYIIPLNKMPLTTNGKIDTKALENYKIQNIQSNNYVPPKTKEQKTFCQILEKLLSTKVGIYDNLFEIGLDSLLAIKLKVELLSKKIDISYADIFKYPTVYELASRNTKSSEIVDLAEYDYSQIHSYIAKKEKRPILVEKDNNVLLLGANGFVGAHILYSFLKKDKGNIYCIVRDKDGRKAKERLLEVLHFYFKEELDTYLNTRFFILTGSITKENFGLSTEELREISTKVSTVINAAANVRHFGNYEKFKEINVDATQNMIQFCLQYHKRFLHLSSLSVSGNSLANVGEKEDNKEKVSFSECNLYVGQNLENVYVRSKFEAEKMILENCIQKGLDAQILRLGNITNRVRDGYFQINPYENAFLIRLVTFLNIHMLPQNLLGQYLEFTPVDSCGDAIISILQNKDVTQKIYHIYNYHHLDIIDFMTYIKELGIYMKFVTEKEFAKQMTKMLKDRNQKEKISGIVNDLTSDKRVEYTSRIQIKQEDTIAFFQKVGFEWPTIQKPYIEKYIAYLRELKLIS